MNSSLMYPPTMMRIYGSRKIYVTMRSSFFANFACSSYEVRPKWAQSVYEVSPKFVRSSFEVCPKFVRSSPDSFEVRPIVNTSVTRE